MKRTRTTHFIISVLIPLSVLSQKSISGTLIDQETKEPIAYAHVFLGDSSKGTFSDLDGSFFLLQDKGSDVKTLVLSHIGYELKKIQLEKEELGTVALKAKNDRLEDIEVSGVVDKKWSKKYEQFKEELFGTTPFADKCKILNPWVIDFKKVQGSFVATANDPIEIANDALGYRISFGLDYFIIKNRVVTIKGTPISSRNISASKELQLEFERNRRMAFEGSIYHFAQSLSNNSLEENGYEVLFVGDELVHLTSYTENITSKKLTSLDQMLDIESKVSRFDFNEFLQVTYKNPMNDVAELSWLKQEGNAYINTEGLIENLDSLKLFGAFANDRLANYLPFSQLKSYYKNQLKTNSIANQIKSNFTFINATEKTYIHTDREIYFPGEDIWLKGYVNRTTDSTRSKKLFVELVNNDSSIVQSIIPIQNNEASGYITIPNVPSGTYLIVSYTDANLDNPDSHFKKPIQVGYQVVGNSEKKQKNRIDIYPEGGELIANVINNIAFEIKDQNGRRLDGEVSLYEGSEKIISTNTLWNGRGTFILIPKQNVKYTLKSDEHSAKLKFEPGTEKIGVIIQDVDSAFRVNLQSNVIINDTIYVTTSHQNKLKSILPSYIYKTHQLSLPKAQLKEGVNTITIFDQNINPVLERVVFIQPELANVSLSVSSSEFQSRIRISGTDSIRTASLSAIDLGKANDRGTESILVDTYLRPEIKGWIENSDQFFIDPNLSNTDLVMLTNGWRRFSNENQLPVDSTIEKTQTGFNLTGLVTFKNSNKASTGNIYLINGLSDKALEVNRVNEQGYFAFDDVYYTDSTNLYFTFDKKYARNVASVNLEEPHTWQYMDGYSFTFDFTDELLNERRRISYEKKVSEQKVFDTSEATELDEVVVLGKEGSSWKKRRYSVTSAEIMSFKDRPLKGYGRNTYTTIDQFKSLQTVIYYETGGAVIRDVKLINTEIPIGIRNDTQFPAGDLSRETSNEVNLFVDNAFMDPIMLLYMDPASFERIEFVKNYGKNGTLFIYTRDTPLQNPTKQVFQKKLKGYLSQKDFYTEKLQEQASNQSATIHWDPHVTNQSRSINFSGPQTIIPIKIILEGYTHTNKPFRLVKTYTSN